MLSFPLRSLVIATHNPGKLREIEAILAPLKLRLSAAGDRGVSEPEETGVTFAENAALKALHSAQATNEVALADDSGLSVRALGGAPGIYSARWAGPEKDFAAASRRIEKELRRKAVEPTGAEASFICVLALAAPDGTCHSFEGRIDGHLAFPPRGGEGFGYDPIFIPEGMTRSFAEMDPQEKHAISHRARAFAELTRFLRVE